MKRVIVNVLGIFLNGGRSVIDEWVSRGEWQMSPQVMNGVSAHSPGNRNTLNEPSNEQPLEFKNSIRLSANGVQIKKFLLR